MRGPALLTIACIGTALAGCAATYPAFVLAPRPAPSGAAEAAYGAVTRDTVAVREPEVAPTERPRQQARVASRATQSDAPRETSPSDPPRYSPEWWKQQEREDDAMKRTLNICRGC
jgi:hypothetical protein